MGFSPRQVDEMTLWELHTCVEAWNAAHDPDAAPPPMSDARFDELMREHG